MSAKSFNAHRRAEERSRRDEELARLERERDQSVRRLERRGQTTNARLLRKTLGKPR